MEELDAETKEQVIDWMVRGENTGVSSKAMAAIFLGREPRRGWADHPHDPSDFNRCLGLLEQAPKAKGLMWKVAELSDVWSRLIARWSEIEATFVEEVGPNWSKRDTPAEKTYRLMRSIIEGES